MSSWQMLGIRDDAKVFLDDARELGTVPDDSAGLVITSPPYANNYDYGDATMLEMTFFGEVSGGGIYTRRPENGSSGPARNMLPSRSLISPLC